MIRRHHRAPVVGPPPAAGALMTAHRLWVSMLWMLCIAATSAVVVAEALGQVLVAMIIGIIAGAFFAGMAS